MRKIICLLVLLQCLTMTAKAQKSNPSKDKEMLSFGEKIVPEGAISTTELVRQMAGKEQMKAKVEGKVASVCQAKGCWAKIVLPDGKSMRVTFKNYAFFVPKDAAGKTMVLEGLASMKTVPVAELQHYAKDAGASAAEIAKITAPERTMTFEASGVVITP